jgi:hypothetical protein
MEKRQLNHYCRLLDVHSGIRVSIASILFELQYQFEGLKKEILTNKISLKENGFAYLILVETEIYGAISHFGDDNYEEKVLEILKKFNIEIDDFLDHRVTNNEFEEIFRQVPDYENEREKINNYKEFIEYYYDFYFFLVIKYANIVINFVKELKGELKTDIEIETKKNKPNQLTANKIVLLLQEIGFFSHPKIEDASKVKQAGLISQITGIHQKTIKTNIEKLDKKSSELTANYQKDIDKINQIIDDLA